MTNTFIARLNDALKLQQYDLALEIYADWFNSLDDTSLVDSTWPRQHRLNAANLARKAFYDRFAESRDSMSERANLALANFVGLTKCPWSHPLQQPSFFFFPSLTAKPIYQLDEIPGLAEVVDGIRAHIHILLNLDVTDQKSYLHHVKGAPKTEDWDKLSTDWQSLHLVSRGLKTPAFEDAPEYLYSLFQQDVIADCPPHAPEVFVSTLEANTAIPPHFGISNIKLTVHVPLKVSSKATLTAGEEVFTWTDNQNVLIFDDSFLHSAKNDATESRSVLIFDIWHPDLTQEERDFIREFMQTYDQWSSEYGALSRLDKGLV